MAICKRGIADRESDKCRHLEIGMSLVCSWQRKLGELKVRERLTVDEVAERADSGRSERPW